MALLGRRIAMTVAICALSFPTAHAQLTDGERDARISPELVPIIEGMKAKAHELGYDVYYWKFDSDRWAILEQRGWVIDRAYYSLYGPKASKSACFSAKDRIGVEILWCLNGRTAQDFNSGLKKEYVAFNHAEVTQFDETGYCLKTDHQTYVSVVVDDKIILFTDKSGEQMDVLTKLADSVRTSARSAT